MLDINMSLVEQGFRGLILIMVILDSYVFSCSFISYVVKGFIPPATAFIYCVGLFAKLSL